MSETFPLHSDIMPDERGLCKCNPRRVVDETPIESAFSTRAVHAGQRSGDHNGAVTVPLYLTSTFRRDGSNAAGWDYSRIANPTRSALEECVASLEGGVAAVATASGMAATATAMLALGGCGAHVVISDDLYGGTWDLVAHVLAAWGLRHTVVGMDDPAALRAAIEPATALVWVETPSNPHLRVTDIAAVAAIAHDAGVSLAVDSTFASPYLQQPLALGADIVMHSTTKYLGGHADVIGGVLVAGSDAMAARLAAVAGMLGTTASPADSWLVARGVKTLAVRMRQICANAAAVAGWLEGHPRVRRVHYPGLASHPSHELACRQMRDFGGVVSFELEGAAAEARAVCERTGVFTLAVSLGGVESLVEHPYSMTHCTLGGSGAAVPETLVRLAIGLEDPDELIADLDAALAPRTADAAGVTVSP